jgi:hypothetical protein
VKEYLQMKTERACRNHVVSILLGASLAASLGLFPALQAEAVVLGGVYQAPGLQPDIGWTSTNMVKNGSAAAFNTDTNPALPNDGMVMRLTPDSSSMAGSAFFNEGYVLGNYSDFTMQFQFRISGSQPIAGRSDGLAFVVGSSPFALGGGGGGQGYEGLTNSFIVEFDVYANASEASSSHIAFMQDGDQTKHMGSSATLLPMDNGDKWEATITYLGNSNALTVTVDDLDQAGNNGATFTLGGIDLPAILGNCGSAGCEPSYFGFTAATGGGFGNQDILGAQLAVPEPGSIPLFAAGFAGLFFIGRRRSSRP